MGFSHALPRVGKLLLCTKQQTNSHVQTLLAFKKQVDSQETKPLNPLCFSYAASDVAK
jgi:hypothetical protein